MSRVLCGAFYPNCGCLSLHTAVCPRTHFRQVVRCLICFAPVYWMTIILMNISNEKSESSNKISSLWIPKDNSLSLTIQLHLQIFVLTLLTKFWRGARWLSGRASDSGARGRRFETYRCRVVSLSKTLYSPKVLVNYPGSDGSVPT